MKKEIENIVNMCMISSAITCTVDFFTITLNTVNGTYISIHDDRYTDPGNIGYISLQELEAIAKEVFNEV